MIYTETALSLCWALFKAINLYKPFDIHYYPVKVSILIPL